MAETEIVIKKSLLILKASTTGLVATENFLRNRDWKVFSTIQMKDALAYLVQNKPSFVMIAVDHPNKKVKSLPKILHANFPCCVIAFVEKTTAASFRLLLEAGTEYKVNPPVTGPAVERTVNKYLRDQQKKKEDSVRASNSGGEIPSNEATHADGEISVQGSVGGEQESDSLSGEPKDFGKIHNKSADVESNLDSGSDDQVAALLEQLRKEPTEPEDFGSVIETGNKEEDREGSILANGDKKKSPSGPAYMGSSGPREKGPAYMGNADASEAGNFSYKDPNKDTPELSAKSEGVNSQEHSALSEGKDGGELQGEFAGRKQKAKNPVYREGDFTKDEAEALQESETETLGHGGRKKKKGPHLDDEGKPIQGKEVDDQPMWGPIASPDKDSAPELDSNGKRKVRSAMLNKTNDTLIVRGAQQALDESVVVGDGKIKNKVENSSNMACIVIDSSRFSGYLVAALGKNQKVDDKFLSSIKGKLVKFLKDHGEEVKKDETLDIKCKQVEFEDWALQYAEFLKKSVHHGNEVAMAFFPCVDAKTTVGESSSSSMSSIKVNDLETEVPLEFNLYMHLPTNNKYILYTPKGSKLYGNQKDRLTESGVGEMHILKSEVQNVSRYKAQNYLNKKIEEYIAKNEKNGSGKKAG